MPGAAMTLTPLERALALLVGEGHLRAHYQPIISLRDDAPGIVGYEAFVRWQQPDGVVLPPAAFVPLAVDAGLAPALDQWMLEQTSLAVTRCSQDLYLNVAVGGVDEGYAVRILAALHACGLSPLRLTLELTEHGHLDVAVASVQLEQLRSHGVRVALDDFGCGTECLQRLVRIPVDVLKLDRGLVASLGASEGRAEHVVGAIVSLSERLGVVTVAEGVETAVEAVAVRDIGCDLAQGFLFGRPGPAELVLG